MTEQMHIFAFWDLLNAAGISDDVINQIQQEDVPTQIDQATVRAVFYANSMPRFDLTTLQIEDYTQRIVETYEFESRVFTPQIKAELDRRIADHTVYSFIQANFLTDPAFTDTFIRQMSDRGLLFDSEEGAAVIYALKKTKLKEWIVLDAEQAWRFIHTWFEYFHNWHQENLRTLNSRYLTLFGDLCDTICKMVYQDLNSRQRDELIDLWRAELEEEFNN